jgi:DNA-binding NtrC family response regulator
MALTASDPPHGPSRVEFRYRGGEAPQSPEHDYVAVDDEERSTMSVLVVEDEHSLRKSCVSLLEGEGFQVTECGRGEEALKIVGDRTFDILLLDLYMSGVPGLEIMDAALERHPDSIAIVMTGNPSVESSVRALRRGAWDYLPKPFSATHFQVLMGRASHAVSVARESRTSSRPPATEPPRPDFNGDLKLDGRSQAFRDVVSLALKVARTDASVFLTGESGVGKEIIAKFIHRNSRRSSRDMVSVNCAAIPEALLESEMFGHVEGAFTGAVREKPGLLEVASGGTLFLDELTELPLPTQAKLLRVLQDGIVRRVGSTRTDEVVNVRFIAATNRDPMEAIAQDQLRKDLHYRLCVVPIHIPPLRERTEEIPTLATDFLQEFWARHRDPAEAIPTFSDDALLALRRSPWPGNVRELRNVLEHLVVLVEPGQEVEPDDIPFVSQAGGSAGSGATGLVRPEDLELDYHTARERVLRRFEEAYLKHVVNVADGNISDAARMAGVDRTTLYRLMEKHNTERDALVGGAQRDPGSPG